MQTALQIWKRQKQKKPKTTLAERICSASPTCPRLAFLRIAGACGGVLALTLACTPQATAQPLKLATWNMEWLLDTASPLSATAPADIPHRTNQDLAALATYAQHLNADVIGFQEVATPAIAARVFAPSNYQIFMTQDSVLQRTGAAIRLGLNATQNPDFTALALNPALTPHPLRSGLDLTLHKGKTSLRLLVVHLKTGCWDNAPTEKEHSCPLLVQQFAALHAWVAARQSAHEAFAIMGDFNRRMTPHDPFFQTLAHDTPLTLATAGAASPCAGGGYFIDHIILGRAASAWAAPYSLRVMVYQPAEKAMLSDHCPVSVLVNMPEY